MTTETTTDEEDDTLSWEEQRDEIKRLNSICIKAAEQIITGKDETVKYYTKDSEPVYTTIADGLDMLSRCSSIARQWMAMTGGSEDPSKIPDEKLFK
jgi:hypothetical protein